MMLEIFDPASTSPARRQVAGFGLSDGAAERLDAAINLRGFIDRLIADGMQADALEVVIRSLPMQYVVPWGCDCIRRALGDSNGVPEVDRAGLALAEQCLKHPTDENWRMCLEFAEKDDHSSPGGWIAAAAAWAHGSLTPPDLEPVRATPDAVRDAVLAALKLVAASRGGQTAVCLKDFSSRAIIMFGRA